MHDRGALREWQVVVVGAGNAGLCAGIAALQAGATSVAILESAPQNLRGGNSSLTKSMRFPWTRSYIADLLQEPDERRLDELLAGRTGYTEDEYFDDWLRVSGNEVDAMLIESIIDRSSRAVTWMREFGQRWVPRPNPLPGDVPVVFDGGGQNFQSRNFDQYERLGGTVFYESPVTDIEVVAGGKYLLRGNGPAFPVSCTALILASGGFEGNAQLRERHLGQPWRDVKLRGVPFNDGAPMQAAIALGADTAGNWRKCHTTPQGVGLPEYLLPGQMHTSHGLTRYAFPRGIVVNRDGRRFFDESAEYSNLAYVTLGQQIMDQPGRVAFQIFDNKVVSAGVLPDGYLSDPASILVPTIEEGARRLAINSRHLAKEIDRLNKTNGTSKRLDTPPYLFVPVVSGLTFTYGGLSVTTEAEVRGGGEPIDGLYAAGVIVGGLYDQGYPAGTGLMAGAVLGRTAGTAAAAYADRAGGR